MNRPNIVFVLTDDQGYPTLGCNGHPFIQTPAIDQFYSESVSFGDFHSGTTCAPTRAGLLTGHYCNSTGVWHTIGGRSLLREDEYSLAAALRDNGYRTGLFGKWHLGDCKPYRPQDRGFEQVVCHGGGGISQQPDYWGNDYFDDTYSVNGEPVQFQGYCTDVFFNEAMKFIEQNRDEPFFCFLSTNAPHSPFNVEDKYRDLYKDHTDSDNFARFLGMITNIDDNFGRLREKLRELSLEDNTVLIFMSDNGQCNYATAGETDFYNAGLRGLKGSEYEGGHRIPFIMRWPSGGICEHKEIGLLASYVDFMPTILDICGIELPSGKADFDGDSLLPLLGSEEVFDADIWGNRTVVTDTQRVAYPLKWQRSCVMKNKWRLVNYDELYDLRSDLNQQNNIAADHPDIVEELRAAYEVWWEKCSRQAELENPFCVGAQAGEVSRLDCMDLRNETGYTVWNQKQVRNAESCLGFWDINVEQDGLYEFELRRWPEEAGHGIGQAINPEDDIEFAAEYISQREQGYYCGSKAMNVEWAQLKISGQPELCQPVEAELSAAVFQVQLSKGNYRLRANFYDRKLSEFSSVYYLYIKLL